MSQPKVDRPLDEKLKAVTRLETAKKVYETVKKIPKGKVMSYGQIALRLRSRQAIKVNPRYVGHLMHKNPDSNGIPCYRVVNRTGRLAENYAFGGWRQQKRKLIKEGVLFKDINHVDKKSFLV
jgi:methylated-DNA-protein-cysteine methyltransferase-like protein